MGENSQLIIVIVLLVAAYFLSRKVHAWRMRRACETIFRDLDARGALDEVTAVRLPYATSSIFRAGTRDYRPKALEFLVVNEALGRTPEGEFFLKEKGLVGLRAMK